MRRAGDGAASVAGGVVGDGVGAAVAGTGVSGRTEGTARMTAPVEPTAVSSSLAEDLWSVSVGGRAWATPVTCATLVTTR